MRRLLAVPGCGQVLPTPPPHCPLSQQTTISKTGHAKIGLSFRSSSPLPRRLKLTPPQSFAPRFSKSLSPHIIVAVFTIRHCPAVCYNLLFNVELPDVANSYEALISSRLVALSGYVLTLDKFLKGLLRQLPSDQLPESGVGGVESGLDAYAKVRAGASLVQLYTALVYHGPGLVNRIKRDLAGQLRADGFATIAEAVGADHR